MQQSHLLLMRVLVLALVLNLMLLLLLRIGVATRTPSDSELEARCCKSSTHASMPGRESLKQAAASFSPLGRRVAGTAPVQIRRRLLPVRILGSWPS